MIVTKRMPVVLKRMFKQIATVLPHVKGRVKVVEGDYTKAPNVEATWFIDPRTTSAGGHSGAAWATPRDAIRHPSTTSCSGNGAARATAKVSSANRTGRP